MMTTALWMSGTILSFCLMAIAARELGGEISVFQILLFRSMLGLILLSILIAGRNPGLFITHRFGAHSLRNLFHFGGQFGWIFGVTALPLADVFALEFTVPVWVAIIAAIFLNERLTWRKVVAVSCGLLGVILIVKPGVAIFNSSAGIVLMAAVCYAVAHTTNKSLTHTDQPLTILFYMCLIQLPLGLLLSYTQLLLPEGIQWLWLTIIGLTALSGHYCLTRAMQLAEVGVVMTLDFFRLPLIALVGAILYAEDFDVMVLFGGALILGGNLLNSIGLPSARTKV